MIRVYAEAAQHSIKALSPASHLTEGNLIAQIFPFVTALFARLTGKLLYFATLETAWWPSFIGTCPAGFNRLLNSIEFYTEETSLRKTIIITYLHRTCAQF